MKKIYLLMAAFGCATTAATAQGVQQDIPALPQEITTESRAAERVDDLFSYNRDVDDTAWIDGFEDAELWEFIAPDGVGSIDSSANGWSIGNSDNSWYGFDDMDTEGNYARFVNGDPTVDPGTFIEAAPWVFMYTGDIPDLTDVPAPHLEFEQYGARFLTDQQVQISTDGGETWNTAASNDDIEPLTNAGGSPYANTETRRFNITNLVADDPANVMIRLFWDGAQNGPEFNYIEYAWFVDNIRIVEGASDDLTLSLPNHQPVWDPNTEDSYRELPYTMYPLSQLRDVNWSSAVTNNGGAEQTNIVLTAEVTGPDGFSETLTSDPITLAPGESDTISIPFTPPAVAGTYEADLSVSSDNEDANPDDNAGSASFMVSEDEYARDNMAADAEFTNFDADYKLGTMFYIENDATLHCIGAGLSAESIPGTSFSMELRGDNLDDYINETEILPVPAIPFLNSDGQNKITWQNMVAPSSLLGGDDVLVCVNHFGGDDDVVVSLSGTSPDQTSFFYEGSEATWFFVSSTPMVRMGLSEEFCLSVVTVGLEEIEEVSVNEIYPNPTKGLTTVEYTLLEEADVQIYLFDQMGRVLVNEDKGTQGVSEYRFEYDWSHLASGTYTFSIHVNGKPITKQLVIE